MNTHRLPILILLVILLIPALPAAAYTPALPA